MVTTHLARPVRVDPIEQLFRLLTLGSVHATQSADALAARDEAVAIRVERHELCGRRRWRFSVILESDTMI